MGWKDWLGLPPTRDDFAAKLIRLASKRGTPGWRYDPTEPVLTLPESGRRFFLQNSWLEYSGATRQARSALLEKYLSMMLSSEPEVPKLWELAAKNLYPCVRSRHRLLTLHIESRGKPEQFPPALAKSWHGDLEIVLTYDLGPSVMQVTAVTADPWGQGPDALFARARANLAALERPSWDELGDGVFHLVSDVSYEESFVLVDAIWNSVQVQGDPVVAIPNRGVLLLTGADSPAGLSRLITEAQRSMQEKPWPLSATLLRRVDGAWRPLEPEAPVVSAARTLELVSLAITYSEQQNALQKFFERENVDIYVAKFDLMRNQSDPEGTQSWCSWAEGVPSLLPLTDLVVLGSGGNGTLIVPWPDVARICAPHMKATDDDPQRFRVDSFPVEEWAQLEAVGRKLT
jgi:hypothetical protein